MSNVGGLSSEGGACHRYDLRKSIVNSWVRYSFITHAARAGALRVPPGRLQKRSMMSLGLSANNTRSAH
jgi:hypothetical protein